MRVSVYVDGFNLYYRALRGTAYKWLNLQTLAHELLDPADSVSAIRYFTARVSSRSGDPDAPRRQQLYLKALKTLPSLTVHYGRFLPKTKWRPITHPHWDPHVFVEIHDTEEKGSDVNLAAHLLNDGWHGRYDVALVMSQDTDLLEPIRMVTSGLDKLVGLVWLDGASPNKRLRSVASFVRHVNASRLARAQFPNPVMGCDGHHVYKPDGW
jgi:hypothetical protein